MQCHHNGNIEKWKEQINFNPSTPLSIASCCDWNMWHQLILRTRSPWTSFVLLAVLLLCNIHEQMKLIRALKMTVSWPLQSFVLAHHKQLDSEWLPICIYIYFFFEIIIDSSINVNVLLLLLLLFIIAIMTLSVLVIVSLLLFYFVFIWLLFPPQSMMISVLKWKLLSLCLHISLNIFPFSQQWSVDFMKIFLA